MAHTGSMSAPNAALSNGVPSLATVKASIDARRPQGCRAGAAAAPAPAPPPSPASAWLRPRGAAQPGEGLHGAAGGRVRRRLVLRAPVPRGRRLRRTRSLRLQHGAGSGRDHPQRVMKLKIGCAVVPVNAPAPISASLLQPRAQVPHRPQACKEGLQETAAPASAQARSPQVHHCTIPWLPWALHQPTTHHACLARH